MHGVGAHHEALAGSDRQTDLGAELIRLPCLALVQTDNDCDRNARTITGDNKLRCELRAATATSCARPTMSNRVHVATYFIKWTQASGSTYSLATWTS